MRSRLLGALLAEAAAASCSSSSSYSGAAAAVAAAATAASRSSSSSSRGFAAAAAKALARPLLRRQQQQQQQQQQLSPLLLPSRYHLLSCSSRSFAASSSSRGSRKKAAAAAAAAAAQQSQSPAAPTTTTTAAATTKPTTAAPLSPSPTDASQRVTKSRYTMTPSAGPGGSMGMSLRVSPVASGVLAEPFRGDPSPLPLSSWVTPSLWKVRWRRWISGAKSMYSLAKCKKLIPGWTLPGFKREALALYESTCRALASGDRGSLRLTLTPLEYAAAKSQIRAREEAGWHEVEWALADPRPDAGRDVEVVHARLVMANAKDERAGFVQVTVRVHCRHHFVARDARGRVVATAGGGGRGGERGRDGRGGGGGGGAHPAASSSSPASSAPLSPAPRSDDRVVDVVDTWVLERFLGGGPSARWRLAGRLSADAGSERRRGGKRGGFWAWLASRRSAAEDK